MAKIVKVKDKRLYVKRLDALDGTPVQDIKPTMVEFLPREKVQ